MTTYTLELKAAEGGDDSKLFVAQLAASYQKLFTKNGWKHQAFPNIDLKAGNAKLGLVVTGDNLDSLKQEAGVHRIQRVPSTEKNKSRVHTSTITVSVTESSPNSINTFVINEKDLLVQWFSGTGAGGQHRNKHQNSCRLIHTPSGVTVCAQTRSRASSYAQALTELQKQLQNAQTCHNHKQLQFEKLTQTGTGERGSLKKRTYRFQDDLVIDHQTQKRANLQVVLNSAKFDLLWV